MNKKIDIYTLLGLIKDGKAPKKIKYLGNIYEYNKKDKRYHNVDPKRLDLSSKFGDFNFNYLDDEVEILDEEEKGDNFSGIKYFSDGECVMSIAHETLIPVEDEFIDIEELKIGHPEDNPSNKYIINEYGTKCFLTKHSRIMAERINDLIKNQKKIIERLNNRDNN